MFLLHQKSGELEQVLSIVSNEFWPSNIVGPEIEIDVRSGSKIIVAMVCTYISTAFLSCWDFMALPLVVGRRELPLPSSFPFAWDETPLFEILYVWHFLSNSFIVVHTIASHDFFLNSLLNSCIAQFKLLKGVLKTVGSRCSEQENYTLVIRCIRHHITVLK